MLDARIAMVTLNDARWTIHRPLDVDPFDEGDGSDLLQLQDLL